ncbi:MAG TPA: GspH/FimT family protein [Alphaproteobacteria bacterium]|nr:GspH/FimT family protein [Alphaproteobacteria bacterium]
MRRPFVAGNHHPLGFTHLAILTSEQGFSLFDLVIAIAIIAILATIALPNMTQEMAKYRLNGAARQIAGELMAARMKAVAQSGNVKVSFPGDNLYEICSEPCGDEPKIINIRDSYKDITMSANSNIEFNAKGLASDFGTINVSNSKGTRSITVAITGRVKIE